MWVRAAMEVSKKVASAGGRAARTMI